MNKQNNASGSIGFQPSVQFNRTASSPPNALQRQDDQVRTELSFTDQHTEDLKIFRGCRSTLFPGAYLSVSVSTEAKQIRKGTPMINSKLEHLFSYTVTMKMPPEVIGPVAEGIRANFYLSGGEISGPRCQGKVLPVGADWTVIRKDGVAMVDVRSTFEMADGALVYAVYNGIADPGAEAYDQFLNGTLPPQFPIRTAPRFHTAHPSYQWMNRVQAYGVGTVDLAAGSAAYDIYAVL